MSCVFTTYNRLMKCEIAPSTHLPSPGLNLNNCTPAISPRSFSFHLCNGLDSPQQYYPSVIYRDNRRSSRNGVVEVVYTDLHRQHVSSLHFTVTSKHGDHGDIKMKPNLRPFQSVLGFHSELYVSSMREFSLCVHCAKL